MSLHGGMSEADWEQLALDTLAEQAWVPKHGNQIAPGSGEREKWEDLLIPSRILAAMRSAEVIAELVAMAQEISAEAQRGQQFLPPLGEDELAFFDAVAQNPSAVDVLGEGKLADIARELVTVMQRDIRTDWTVREDVRARLRSSIRRALARHGYPPDKAPEAIKLVMEQMESTAPRYSTRRRTEQGH